MGAGIHRNIHVVFFLCTTTAGAAADFEVFAMGEFAVLTEELDGLVRQGGGSIGNRGKATCFGWVGHCLRVLVFRYLKLSWSTWTRNRFSV